MIKDPLTGEVVESEHVDLNEEMDRTMGVALVHKFYDKKKKPTLRERLELQRKERLASGYGKRKKEISDIDYQIKEYWYIKGEYIYCKANPVHKLDEKRILEYLWCCSNLFTYHFWANASYENQQKLCSCLKISEETNSKIISQDQIIIILNGKVTVHVTDQFMKTTEITYHIGNVCGAIELFNRALKNPDDLPQSLWLDYHISIHRATLLILNLEDFIKIACVKDTTDYKLVDKYMKMNFAERKLFEVTGIMKSGRLTQLMQNYLISNKLLSHTPSDESFSYICEDSHGTKIPLNSSLVYIILEGSMRLVVEKSNKMSGALSCVDELGNPTISIKTDSIPLVLLDEGSILSIEDDFVNINMKDMNSVNAIHLATEFDHHHHAQRSQVSNNITESGGSIYSSSDASHTKRTPHITSEEGTPTSSSYPSIEIYIVFDRNCRYLAVPKAAANRALRTEALDVQPIIRKEIDQLGEMLKNRLVNLFPWIQGNLNVSLNLPQEKQIVLSDFEQIHKKEPYEFDNTPNYSRQAPLEHELLGTYGIKPDVHAESLNAEPSSNQQSASFYLTA